ncbi:hypothetical protein [Sphingomonas sanxanigenens]|uniref:Uncharacterized protein n=1 Tax=Sphingomonas sanxanigenens DSM 19645 = NX02 TaxID=1123269 RepID=W0AM91_9SPHN|nr:hypothetical protein [Sphingomonas sanxanigenens]AHE57458.1 hypothetical protein NX02_29470 [Sphingomonas sanxanigenens DSM 19645 = NX02]
MTENDYAQNREAVRSLRRDATFGRSMMLAMVGRCSIDILWQGREEEGEARVFFSTEQVITFEPNDWLEGERFHLELNPRYQLMRYDYRHRVLSVTGSSEKMGDYEYRLTALPD